MWRALFVYLSLAEQAVNSRLYLPGVLALVDAFVVIPVALDTIPDKHTSSDCTRALVTRWADRRIADACLDFLSMAAFHGALILVVAFVAQLMMSDGVLLALLTQLAFVPHVIARILLTQFTIGLFLADVAITSACA